MNSQAFLQHVKRLPWYSDQVAHVHELSPREARSSPLVQPLESQVQGALEAIRGASRETLFAPRSVGRAALPTNVFGLLCHVAEHTQRHTGQVITTAKIVRGLGLR